jgi:hypothetical protein
MPCNDSDGRSPFERPKISLGYPLDANEKLAIEEGLAALREERPAPLTACTCEPGGPDDIRHDLGCPCRAALPGSEAEHDA